MASKPDLRLNVPQKGLNRDQYNLGEADYSTLLNGLFDGIDGGSFTLTNEMSNLLSSKFKQGFKVIKATNDTYSNTTYFFLVNPITGVGEFGQIKNIQQVVNIEDIISDCEGCVEHLDLAEPLEDQVQVELNDYETILTDACHIAALTPELGFQFSIHSPIKKTVIKNEKCGKTIYFSDDNTPPRYIVLDNISQYQVTGSIVCGVDMTTSTCLDADKLLIFKRYNLPKLFPVSIQLGGRLKLGVYEFLIAYCDQIGNEISEYTSITNPIQIFDRNNVTLTQAELSTPTNFSIKLEVEGLDERFTHYKIAVIQNTLDSVGATRFFIEGIHVINDNVVIYGGEHNKQSAELSDLIRENLYIQRWEFLVESNNSLIGAGITAEKEINLQPVINFLGTFLKWQTHIASEDLYQDGVNTSLFLGYNRDEVVPFSIRFLLDGGYKTALFPLIGRQAQDSDLEEVDELNKDRVSIESNKGVCNTTDRTKVWQFYNTATEDDEYCSSDEIEFIEVEEAIEKICVVESVATIPGATFTIETDEPFIDLLTFIEDNKEFCLNVVDCNDMAQVNTYPFCNYFDIDCYTDQNCMPNFNSQRANTIVIGDEYIIYTVEVGDDFSNTGYLTSGTPFVAIASPPLVWTNETEVYKKTCTTPVLQSEEIVVASITGTSPTGEETIVKIEKDFPDEYAKIKSPQSCVIYETDTSTGNTKRDVDFEDNFMECDGASSAIVYERDFNFNNVACSYADDVINVPNANTNIQGYFHNYEGALTIADLQTTKNTVAFSAEWTNKIQNGALWFKADTQNRDKFILEVSKQNLKGGDDISGGQIVRMSIYNKCSSATPLYSVLVDLTSGQQFQFEKIAGDYWITDEINPAVNIGAVVGNSLYVAVDIKIVAENASTIPGDCSFGHPTTVKYITSPTDGCFGIVTRDVEHSQIDITYTSIVLNKKQTYVAACTFEKPILNSCTAVPYKKGDFAFWESQESYPDNPSLYDSSTIKVKPADIPIGQQPQFEAEFADGLDINGFYIWKEDDLLKPLSNFSCRGIRHFKFPDNKISPFMYENTQLPQANSIIYPLGITVNEELINSFLDIAVDNDLLTQEKRNQIQAYEIFRGDVAQDRSILSSGLIYDMRKYNETSTTTDQVYYSNYPYNDLGADILNLDSDNTGFGVQNDKFTFHSPETDYSKPTLPTEMSIQGYMFGQSSGYFDEVKDHMKMVILTNKARNLANLLAGLEAATEIAVALAQAGENYRVAVGTSSSFNPVGVGLSITASALSIISTVVANFGRYRYEWLKTFRDLGQPENFGYYYHSSGKYNFIKTLQEDEQRLRGLHSAKYLKEGNFTQVDDVTGKKLSINNIDREKSVLLTFGELNPLVYPSEYANYDNNTVNDNDSSLTIASENNACVAGRSKEIKRNVASPYVAIKNYLPAQYGTIGSVKWLSTSYKGDLRNPSTDCLSIFGGDTFISRHTLKRKLPLFFDSAFGLADLTPFNYKFYNNIGKTPRFYIDYEVLTDFERQSALFPDIDYQFNFDCNTKIGNYYRPPSKFYLWYYGVPNFLTESRINTWNRTAEPTPERNFFPNTGDTAEWTQEKNVSIKKAEFFFYNSIYSKMVTTVAYRTLSDTFNQSESDCRNDKPNGIMWSQPDSSENNYSDPYLNYKPLDFYEFDTKYGKLKDIRTIEREQILVRQENATSLFNAIDAVIDDGKRAESRNLTSAFARRALTYSETDLGYGGTQSSQSVSCEFGHFHCDVKRGQVIHIPPGGKGMEEISSLINGKPSGIRNWFKEHLPFKILKSNIAGIADIDTDNAYNGVGLTMGYDSRFRRVFITKKDYIAKTPPLGESLVFSNNTFYRNDDVEIALTNETYFENVSFTIAYSPIEQKWIGWSSFCPNYYVEHNNYFQTGINQSSDPSEFGLWSHLLTNRSYQVFYGKKYPFLIEYMLKREYGEMMLKAVGIEMYVQRYHNEYDTAEIDDKPFNKMWIHSPHTNSGELHLIPNTGQISLISKYPITAPDGTYQEVLISKVHNEYTVNYFYNRMLSHKANQPTWLWDKNQITKSVNQEIVRFGGKTVLEMMRSNYFTVMLEQSKESRLRYSVNMLGSKLNLEM